VEYEEEMDLTPWCSKRAVRDDHIEMDDKRARRAVVCLCIILGVGGVRV